MIAISKAPTINDCRLRLRVGSEKILRGRISINSITAYRSPNDYSITWSSGGGEGSVQMITVLHRVCRANDYGVYTMILEGLYKEFKDLTKISEVLFIQDG